MLCTHGRAGHRGIFARSAAYAIRNPWFTAEHLEQARSHFPQYEVTERFASVVNEFAQALLPAGSRHS